MNLRYLIPIFWGALSCVSCTSMQHYEISETDGAGFTSTVLPFAFGEQQEFERIPFITVEIQGQPFRLMMDTGAEWTVISLSPAAIEQLQAEPTEETVQYLDAEGNKYQARTFRLPEVVMGELTLTDVPVAENLNAHGDFDGYIGLELLRNFHVLFDYRARSISLYRNNVTPGFLQSGGWHRARFHDKLSIEIRPDFLDRAYSVIIDTGSGYFVMPKQSGLAEAIMRHNGSGAAETHTNSRTGLDIMFFSMEHAFVGEYDIGNQDIVIMDMGGYLGDGITGFNLFDNNRVFIDFSARDIWFRKY